MVDTTSINRTYHPKYVTYTGDGSGRDQYVTFANGGLHELRDYQGSKPRNQFNCFKNQPVHHAQPRKEATAFDYVPDGSGRDSYVIFNYGLKANYRSGYKEFERDLRSGTSTPMMDARQARRNDPWGTDVSSYQNWPSPSARHRNRQVYDEQRASIERLSKSPPNKSRSKVSSTERLQVMMPVPVQKHRQMNQTQVLKLADEIGREQFFSSRNAGAPVGHQTTTAKKNSQSVMRAVQTSRKNESLNVLPVNANHVNRTLNGRKHSIGVTTPGRKAGLLDLEEDGNDYAPAFRKKMSVPQAVLRQRANSTLQYASPVAPNGPSQPRLTTTAEPMNRGGIRFKKVGNLMTLEQSYPGGQGRAQSLNKTAGQNNNLFLRNIFNEQNGMTPQKINQNELDQLKQQNQALRQKIGIGQHLPQSRPVHAVQRSVTSIERGGNANMGQSVGKQQKVTITEELRKGLNNSALAVKKMDTEITKNGISTMETSVNGTRFDQRKSIDRTMMTTANNEQDYGSILSPGSPVKPGRADLASGYRQQRTDAKQQFQERRNTTANRESSLVKRSSSVQQGKPMGANAAMAKTAPQGFFKHSQQHVAE